MRGYLDHESAHIRHTDFDGIMAQKPTALEKALWNTLEDWRVETELGKRFPGCRTNFHWLIRHLFTGQGELPSLSPVLDWILLTVRSWIAPEIAPDRDTLSAQLDTLIPSLTGTLRPILEEARQRCHDSLSCLEYARKIVQKLRQTANDLKRNRRKGAQTPTEENAAQVSGGGAMQARHHLEQLLKTPTEKHSSDLGAILKERLQESIRAMPSNGPKIEMATEESPTPLLIDAAFRHDTRATALGLRARLHGLIQATRLVRHAPSRRGTLDCHRLYGVAVSDPRLFRRSQPKPAINTAVHLILDASGSMHKRMTLAGQACLALAQALEQAGVSVGITAFRGRDGGKLHGEPLVIPLLRHGERVKSITMLETPGGSTPLAEALWWVLPRLAACRETRKIVIIVTDGVPDSADQTTDAVAALEKIGLEVYALGIRSSRIGALFPNKSASVATLKEIPQAIFGLVDKALFKGAQTR